MKNIIKSIMAVALCALPLCVFAEVNIDFESTKGYKALGVYDVWEQSPFRTGELHGNWAITPNPDRSVNEVTGEIPNDSEYVLGAQRSRFGSNRFGVRIDLEESFEISPTTQYVHVMIHKPKEGRVMLVGLGSRKERLGQNPYAEQFWELSTNAVEPGKWYDAVFAVRGANGINIRSLVVVPDCESPHNLTEDFLFYVDNIVVNNSSLPRITNEFYPIIGTKDGTEMTRTDRYTSAIKLKVGSTTQSVSITQTTNKKLYQNVTDNAFYAKAGQTLTPSVTYNGTWMHAYCYIDYNNDGNFTATINANGTPAEGSELVSYNQYQGKNSQGASVGQNLGSGVGTMPSFKLPEDLQPGMYRMRMKIDWDCIDPMGNSDASNNISSNGGVIADVMLCVYGDEVIVNDFQLNGEVLAADGRKLNSLSTPSDKEFTIRVAPEKGFHNGGVDINCGYNLNGDPVDKYGNPQFVTYNVPLSKFAEDGTYTIPADRMRGNLLINGRMIEDGTIGSPVSEGYLLNFPEELKVTRTDRKLNSFALNTEDGTIDVSLSDNTDNYVYVAKLDTEVPVKAGQRITPSVNYIGNAMHTYWYVDLNEDGEFLIDLKDNGTPTDKGELLSYSSYNGKNSLGANAGPGGITPATNHPFLIPEETPAGLYRARFKIDWNNADSGGQYGLGSNDINANGGFIVDFMIHVYTEQTPVSANISAESGNIKIIDSSDVLTSETYLANRNTALTIDATSTNDIAIDKLIARCGYHLDGQRSRFSNIYWNEVELIADGGTYTIPASMMDRPVYLNAKFNGVDAVHGVTVNPADGTAYNLKGIRVDKPSNGLYIINGQKTIIK